MKILVDKLPESGSDCIFSEYNHYSGEYTCKITNCKCYVDGCPYLKETK